MPYDVIVVGAGMAGLLTAYYLKESGRRVLVLEAKTVATRETERTTAKITSQHGVKYSTLMQKVGKKRALLYAKANEEAIFSYEKLIKKEHIECQFVRVPAFLYTKREETVLREEAKAAASLGIDATFTTDTELPFPVEGAVRFGGQAQFSPLEFLRHIAVGLEIREKHDGACGIRQACADGCGRVSGGKCRGGDALSVSECAGILFLRQHQERSYVLALSGCDDIRGMYYGVDEDGISLRQAGDVLLFGGGGHRTGEAKQCGAYEALLEKARYYYPDCREVARWSAQDCMPHDGIPLIGRYSVFTPHLYVATGFQKWGMTSSMVAALLLRDELCGVENPYRKLFSPQRLCVRAGIRDFLTDVGMSVKGLVRELFCRPRCPHMGCELEWNPQERSWDCPCHGSRFDEDGKLLDNPAKRDIENW